MTTLYKIDPLDDPRWEAFLQRHPRASVFHTTGWLNALRRTYGYEPLVLTTSNPQSELTNGVALCHVRSWLTGSRLVSLPFSDHCDLLINDPDDYPEYVARLREECDRHGYKYVELRPLSVADELLSGMRCDRSYCLHELDLGPTVEQLFRRLHKHSFQRRIHRAEKEHLVYERGRSEDLFDQFYRLLVMTRRRHQLPPQPRSWFTNLYHCMGTNIEIRVVRKNVTPIVAILTLRHRTSVVYKYGCSDDRFHHIGAMPFLVWRLIEESKGSGAEIIDFGRSDLDNAGLMRFKDECGATRRVLRYYRHPDSVMGKAGWGTNAMRRLVTVLPNTLVCGAGKVLYRHMG